jgi:hypothetical protein
LVFPVKYAIVSEFLVNSELMNFVVVTLLGKRSTYLTNRGQQKQLVTEALPEIESNLALMPSHLD